MPGDRRASATRVPLDDARARSAPSASALVLGFVLGMTSVGSGRARRPGADPGLPPDAAPRRRHRRLPRRAHAVGRRASPTWSAATSTSALMANILIGSLPGVVDRRRACSPRVPAAALRPALGCVLLGSALGVLSKAGVDLAAVDDRRRCPSLVGLARLRSSHRARARAAPSTAVTRMKLRTRPPRRPSRPRRSTSCARSPPSSSARCCSSAAARTRSCCCAWPRRRSARRASRSRSCTSTPGHNFPEVIEFRDRRVAELGERLIVASRAGVDRRRAAWSRRPARAPRATACRRRRCSTRSPSTASTRPSAARAATRSARARRSASSPSATTSAAGTPRPSAPSCGTSTTGASARASTSASSRCPTGPSSTSGSTSRPRSLEVPSIYFAHEREVFRRDGMLYAVSRLHVQLHRRRGALHRERCATARWAT